MINAIEFKERWNQDIFPLIKYTSEKVHNLNIDNKDKELLLLAGLPESAAPFLTFREENDGGLARLREIYKLDGEIGAYLYLGHNASGDYIVLNEENGEVLCINHESLDSQYVNKSILQLAESLLEYADFVNHIKQISGRRAYISRECPMDELEIIKNKLISIDSLALQEESFWNEEIEFFVK